MKMTRILVAVILTLVANHQLRAQVRKVHVSEGRKGAGLEIVNALKAKIGSSSRYALTEKETASELGVEVACIEQDRIKGFTCAIDISLYSKAFSPLPSPIAALYIAQNADAGTLAETLFDYFVQETSEEKIHLGEEQTRLGISIFCHAHKNECQ
jgi:hypothetical protein